MTNYSIPQQTATLFRANPHWCKIIFIAAVIICVMPFTSPAMALVLGLIIAQVTGHPYLRFNHNATQLLLQFSVVGLGFGMNVNSAVQAGRQGIAFTVVSITTTLVFGYLLGKWFNVEKRTSYLVATGTAICGGSAIAAIAPVIKAEEKHISVALACVFLLNSVALVLFPVVGHYFNLSQTQFGLWCAIAVHDTSSVVGAASKYGSHALEVATTVKLARALWIIPVAFLSAFVFKNQSKKVSIPYFIGLFIIAVVLNTYIPFVHAASKYILLVSKAGLTLTLFLIGAGLSRQVLRSVGTMPLLQAVLLWVFIASGSLYAVIHLA